jgi:hypothetical protein
MSSLVVVKKIFNIVTLSFSLLSLFPPLSLSYSDSVASVLRNPPCQFVSVFPNCKKNICLVVFHLANVFPLICMCTV